MNPQAFFLVGHRNWGKSRTLQALTGGSHQVRNIVIGNRTFFIRRMSNDDDPEGWERRVNELRPSAKPHVILTVCPTETAMRTLRVLGERFGLFFWIMRHSYDGGRVRLEEERQLEALGVVEIFEGRREASDRAGSFRNFIIAHP